MIPTTEMLDLERDIYAGIPREPRYPRESRGNGLKMQSHPEGRSGMVMLLSGTVASGFTCVPRKWL